MFFEKFSCIVVDCFWVGFPEKLKKPTMTFWVFVGGPVSWTAVASASGRAPSPGRDWPLQPQSWVTHFPVDFFFFQRNEVATKSSSCWGGLLGILLKNRSWAFGIEYVNKNDEIWRLIYILRTFFEGTLVVNNLYQTLISGGGRLGKFA